MADTSLTLTSTALSRQQRNKATHLAARWGNYHQYYSFRAATVPDPRLSLLPRSILHDARVLDLGCNAGKLTSEVVTHCGARAAVGVDIDPDLVAQAQAAYPHGPASFECFDFVDADAYTGTAHGVFDAVLLLSVTKWVHLNHGDAGMLRLFALIHDVLLRDGGHLVLEPQPVGNYKSAAKKNKELRETWKGLAIWPPFTGELNAAGFEMVMEVEREEEGFSRPVHVWRKV